MNEPPFSENADLENPDELPDDLLRQAVREVRETPGADGLPDAVRRRAKEIPLNASPATPPRERVAWGRLAATALAAAAVAWGVGFHEMLLSRPAARTTAADGVRFVVYTDGRVVRLSDG